jgi:hypothetical protein
MNPKKRYVLQDFVQHAQKRFPREFAGVVDSSGYDFTRRTFLDANNAVREVVVLLVGHYHKRHGGPSVWARATGSSIQYFPEDQKTRVYYDAPYSSMAGSQDGKGMTVGRRAGQIVVETFINFLFLWTGYIKEVNNSERSDLLTNFEYACTKMQSVQSWPDALKLPVEPRQATPRPFTDQQISKKRKREVQENPSMEKAFTRIKKDIDVDEVVFIKANCTPSVTRKHSE